MLSTSIPGTPYTLPTPGIRQPRKSSWNRRGQWDSVATEVGGGGDMKRWKDGYAPNTTVDTGERELDPGKLSLAQQLGKPRRGWSSIPGKHALTDSHYIQRRAKGDTAPASREVTQNAARAGVTGSERSTAVCRCHPAVIRAA